VYIVGYGRDSHITVCRLLEMLFNLWSVAIKNFQQLIYVKHRNKNLFVRFDVCTVVCDVVSLLE